MRPGDHGAGASSLAGRGAPAVRMALGDPEGGVHVHPSLGMAIFDGRSVRPARLEDCVPVPDGSDFYTMPGRLPLGWDHARGEAVAVTERADGTPAVALSTFLAPAWTRLAHPATERLADAPVLPLYAYSAVGVGPDGRPVTCAIRVDPDPRQDPARFDRGRIRDAVRARRAALPDNRLVEHVSHCALVYGCRAAQNFFLGRWEAPIPVARACNARCVGCISLQKDDDRVASHDRIGFNVTPEEIAGLAVDHLKRVPTGIVSFGQGCEGEPLLYADVGAEAVRQVRRRTEVGTLHINTNASRPDGVRQLVDAGLDSLRASLNSAIPEVYRRYYRPTDYAFEDVATSLEAACAAGCFVSLNLLVFPGVTDTPAELEALRALHARAPFHMIQWRNLNVDPDDYVARMADLDLGEAMGLGAFIEAVETALPGVRRGYFNPARHKFSRG